jgi:ribulose-5-phosphate 4-epimerase/fuculose-1-phosphate aldolase
MKELLRKYEAKLVRAGLAPAGAPLLAGLDDELLWNRRSSRTTPLARLFDNLSVNSLVLLPLSEPHASCVAHCAAQALKSDGVITPQDCETRTFLHDLPVVRGFDVSALLAALERRKGAVILEQGVPDIPWVIATGSVSPEQGFVTCSSISFACFVKLFADALEFSRRRPGMPLPATHAASLVRAMAHLPLLEAEPPRFRQAPFASEEELYLAIIEAGRATVEYGLVDSYFGNISYLRRQPPPETLFISQTGSSLDELAGHVDPCPLDGSSTAALTASSELTAHIQALTRSGAAALLHGHPKFSVIMSMDCAKPDCPSRGRCHLECREERLVRGVPVVPGEVGTGPFGLCNTLPPALERYDRAMVHGHGVFCLGREDFNQAFAALLEVERSCMWACLERLAAMGVHP